MKVMQLTQGIQFVLTTGTKKLGPGINIHLIYAVENNTHKNECDLN